MSHSSSYYTVILALILFLLTFSLLIFFYIKRKKSSIKALDYIIGILFGASLLAVLNILEFYFHNSWPIFGGTNSSFADDVSTLTNIVILVQFILNLYIYFVAESFLQLRPKPIRLVIISLFSGVIFILSAYFALSGERIPTTSILYFASETSGLDSLVFDLLQLFIICLLAYAYVLQFKFTSNSKVKKYISILLLSIGFYVLGSISEFLEHFNFPDVDGNIAAIFTFLVLAVFYIKFPNFIYLTPANISFVQVVSKSGISLYKAEVEQLPIDGDDDVVHLIGPALSAVNQLVSEFVQDDSQSYSTNIKSIGYGHSIIMFETTGEIRVILETDRVTAVLQRSLRYFLEEFDRVFQPSLGESGGIIDIVKSGITPEELFIKCIPIISSKTVISQYA